VFHITVADKIKTYILHSVIFSKIGSFMI